MKTKISEILKQHGLLGNDIRTRLKNGQISLNCKPLNGDVEIDIKENFRIEEAGDFICKNISNNEHRLMLCKIFGFEDFFSDEINFNNELTEFLKEFKSLKISKKEILIIG